MVGAAASLQGSRKLGDPRFGLANQIVHLDVNGSQRTEAGGAALGEERIQVDAAFELCSPELGRAVGTA